MSQSNSDVSESNTEESRSSSDNSEDERVSHFALNVLLQNPPIVRQPKNTSILQGADWVAELLYGHPGRFYDQARMTKDVFFALVNTLVNRGLLPNSSRAHVSPIESVMIFVRMVCMHHRHRDEEERVQHSTQTINVHFHRVMEALIALGSDWIKPPDYTRVPHKILMDDRFFSYFEGAVGAIDGTLISARVPSDRDTAWITRKGTKCQNVCAIVDFEMFFTYVYAGWEGSTHDARVLMKALELDESFSWPPDGRYYLADAGYTNYAAFLAPYRQTRYNLPEFHGNPNPLDRKELFNHRHSQLRNVIERAFGCLKSRFPILAHGMPCYRIGNQPRIVVACCVLHNFVKASGLPDPILELDAQHYHPDELIFSGSSYPTPAAIHEQNATRDGMAQAMWESHINPNFD